MLEPTKMQSNADAHKNVTRPIPNSNVGQESEWIEAQSRYDHFPLNKNDVVTLIDFKYHYLQSHSFPVFQVQRIITSHHPLQPPWPSSVWLPPLALPVASPSRKKLG